ncbi:MAG: PhoH family protein, partial [Oscillospiraceae bacterium]
MIERIMAVDRMEQIISVFGSFDRNIHIIEGELGVSVTDREGELHLAGEAENVMLAEKAITGLLSLAARGESIDEQNVRYIIKLVREGGESKIDKIAGDVVCITCKGKPVKAKTIGQKDYVDAIKNNTVTIGVGPAGTGKTYLAVAAAVASFRNKEV